MFGIILVIIILLIVILILDLGGDDDFMYTREQLPRLDGRSDKDGTWYIQTYPFRFHVYSAFFDNRTTLGHRYNYLRIIIVAEKLPYSYELYCHVYHPHTKVLNAYLQEIGAGVEHGEKLYIEYILTCSLPRSYYPPLSVAITDNKGELNISGIPVEIPEQAEVQQELAICVSVSYYKINPLSLVEWLEMQKILGVSRVFIYNNSITGEANRILSMYRDEGFVEVRHSFSFVPGPEEELIHLHMSPVINDCMYRNMFAYRYFAVIDLDEVVVPRQYKLLPEFIRNLPRLLDYGRVGSFIFLNAYFFFDLNQSGGEVSDHRSLYLTYRKRLFPSQPKYSSKSIVDSQACEAMHNHNCFQYTAEVESQWTLFVTVPSKMALLHHYKWCHLDSYFKSSGSCTAAMKDFVFDNIIDRYHYSLVRNLKSRLEKLKLL